MSALLILVIIFGLACCASVIAASRLARSAHRLSPIAKFGLRGTQPSVSAFDETESCSKCGCTMVDDGRGWRCPECKNLVEAE